MKCPVCEDPALCPAEVEKNLIGAQCEKCSGVLISLMNYRFWLDRYSTGDIATEHLAEESVVAQDSTGAKQCPKCSKLMLKYRIGRESENRVDLCSHCQEAWLDSGEWQLLKKLDAHDKLPEIFTDAWQRNLRKQQQRESMDRHFADVIGAKDFTQVRDFKIWLDSHPKRADIKHYLTTNFDI